MIIVRNIIVGMEEEFLNVVFRKQGAAKDPHDLHDWAIELEVVFDDSDETVGDNGHMDLYAYSILRLSPKGLDTEVLFDPFEEEFNLPPVAVQKSDILSVDVEVIGIVCKDSLHLRRIVDNSPEFRRIVVSVILPGETDCLVSDDIVIPLKEVFSSGDLICRMPLLPNDKRCTREINTKESRKVKVSSVKYIAGLRLVCDPIHEIDIMDISIGDSVEDRNLRDDVDLGVDSDARLCCTKPCPSENRHAEVDGRGVDSIESPMQLEFSDDAFPLSNLYHMECKFLKDAIVSDGICFREQASIDCKFSKPEMIRLLFMCDNNVCKFSQTTTSKQLAEHQNEKVRPMRRGPIKRTVIVLQNKPFKESLRQKFYNLAKNILLSIHISIVIIYDANIRISNRRQDIIYPNNCA